MSPLEQHVTQAVGKAQPGAAVDFGIIRQIMSMVLQFIQQCPFGNAKRAIREGAVEAKVAAYQAVKSSGYNGNAVDLTNALIEQGRAATDADLDATIASAHALPFLRHPAGAALLAWLLLGSAAIAGPFPERSQSVTDSGPFPVASGSVDVGGRDSEDECRMSKELARSMDSISSGEPLDRQSRIQNPRPSTLRDRIADYRAHGGGTVGVRGMTITTHMLRDHGWSDAQLAGLTADELYLLHGMQHAGRIDPHAVGREPDLNTIPVSHGFPVSRSGNTAYWMVDGVRWSNLGGGMPVAGQVYTGGGRAFVYRDGRMHAVEDAGTRTAPGCAGGRCRIR